MNSNQKTPIFVTNLIKMKFVDVKNDVAFRKIFGNEKKKSGKIMKYSALSKEQIEDLTL